MFPLNCIVVLNRCVYPWGHFFKLFLQRVDLRGQILGLFPKIGCKFLEVRFSKKLASVHSVQGNIPTLCACERKWRQIICQYKTIFSLKKYNFSFIINKEINKLRNSIFTRTESQDFRRMRLQPVKININFVLPFRWVIYNVRILPII